MDDLIARFMMQAAREDWSQVIINKRGKGEETARNDTY